MSEKQVIAEIGGKIINLSPKSQKLFPLPKTRNFLVKKLFLSRGR